MAISDWFKSLFKASSFQGTVYSDPPTASDERHAIEELGKMSSKDRIEVMRHAFSSPAVTPWPVFQYNAGRLHEMLKFSEHFTEREVACRDKDGTMPTGSELENAKKAAEMMEAIRSHLGDRPITVNSWFRTGTYNRQVGGAKNSYHVKGCAVDFTVEGLTPAQVQRKLIAARDSGKLAIGGIGRYKTFTHIDLGPKRTWRG